MPDYIFLIFYQRFLQLLKGKNYYFKKSCTAYFFSICLKTSDKRNENYVHTQTRDVYRLRGIATDGRTVDGRTDASVFQFAIRGRSASTLIYFRFWEKVNFVLRNMWALQRGWKSLLVFNVDKVILNSLERSEKLNKWYKMYISDLYEDELEISIKVSCCLLEANTVPHIESVFWNFQNSNSV